MAFNSMLRDASPEQFARAAKVLAKDILRDPKSPERVRKIAQWVDAATIEELIAAKPGYDERWDARHPKEGADVQ